MALNTRLAFGVMAISAVLAAATEQPRAGANYGLLTGRVTTDDLVFEGRLRWGGSEEALWGNYFNGAKDRNPWAAYVPSERLPKDRDSIQIFGIEIASWTSQVSLSRPFMARFGEIARIEPRGRDLQVTLKSGTLFHLNRYGADDMNDGVRVWDSVHGIVDISEWRIRSIEFLGTASRDGSPAPLYGTVRTRQGNFTGFVQWDRKDCLGSDELDGQTADGPLAVRFDTIRSIARHSPEGSRVTLVDGREIVLFGSREVSGRNHRGIYVDDRRYGRVLVSWDAFERVDFSQGGTGPGYGDFPPGHPLTGSVVTRSGRRLSGRLVYDLDESETTETLDAPLQGVDYTIPFNLVASIVLPDLPSRDARRATVLLRSGEALQLERSGDLGEWNAGVLIFLDGRQQPEYVSWTDVKQVDFDSVKQH